MRRALSLLLPVLTLSTAASAQPAQPAATAEAAPPAAAQPSAGAAAEPAATPPAKPDSGLRITITPRAEYTFEADLDDADASAAVTRAGAEFFMLYPLNDRTQLTLSVDGDYSWYKFNGQDPAVFAGRSFSDLLDDAVKIDILPGIRYGIDEHWTVIGGAIIEFAGAPDVDVGDAATFGGFGGARYAFNDRFALTLGGGIKSRLEDDPQFLPFIGLEWKISERFRLASKGPGINLAVAVSDQVAVTAGFAYDSRDYRLADDNAFYPSGVARDTRFPIRVGVEWAPSKKFSIEGYTGVVVWQEYEFLDQHGQKQIEDNTDMAPFIGVNCSFKF
jgi:hypothetical protein